MLKLELLMATLAISTFLWIVLQPQAWSSESKSEPSVRIEPIPPAPPNQNQYIGFKLMAPWIDGYIRVRFPENVDSSLGRHFLDNLQPDIKRVSDVKVPIWDVDEKTGAICYWIETKEGVHFGGEARVEGDVVHMTFRVRNESGRALMFNNQICFDMAPSRNFGERVTLDHTYAWFDGAYRCFTETTSPNNKLAQNGYNWVLILNRADPDVQLREIEDDMPWWIADQMADHPIIVRETPDGKHLLAMTWDHTVRRLMTNTNIPCLHTDPLHVEDLPDGAEKVWKGRIYAMENDPERLLERCKEDVTPKP